MSIIGFKTTIIMASIDSPFPTYSSIVTPLMDSVATAKATALDELIQAKKTLADYKGEITSDIIKMREELDNFNLQDLMKFEIPKIPGLPIPIFPDLSSLSVEITEMAQSIQQFQLLDTIMSMIKPMVSYIGTALESILPKDPIFGLSPLDILSMSGSDLYEMVYSKFKGLQTQAVALAVATKEMAEAIGEEAIAIAKEKVESIKNLYETAKSVVEGFLSKVSGLLPSPIFPGISALQLEAMEIVKAIKSFVINLSLNIILGLINRVLKILKWASFDLFPITIPTLAELKEMLLGIALELVPNDIPYVDDIQALIELSKAGFTLSDLVGSLSLPGFPSISLPDPLIPSISCLAIEIQKSCQIIFTDMMASILGKLVDFVKGTLGLLGIQFLTLQIPIPIVTVQVSIPTLIPPIG